MDFLWIFVAFICGFLAKQIGLPPLVGYLLAGFGLHAQGIEPFDGLEMLSNLGITLLLFTIGLKINFRDLATVEVYGGTLGHMLVWILISVGLMILGTWGMTAAGLSLMTALLIGFALSFSSTVCVMKILEDNAELKTRHGDLSMGVLVIQDIVAVLFLVFASGEYPSPWALLVLLLPIIRPLFVKILDLSGHGELVVLVGFFLALGGAELFELVGIKGDLGALIIGMLIAGTPKANELYKSLMSFKDLFLIGFFLLIGFSALPTWELLGWALLITVGLSLKMVLFFFIFIALGLRARTSFLSALALMNFSEFGLIVTSYSLEFGWLSADTLVVLALAVSFSFALSSLLYNYSHQIYTRIKTSLCRFERADVQTSYEKPQGAEVLIIGMGRVGSGAYKAMNEQLGDKLWGVEADQERVKHQQQEGIRVVYGDADDIDFWEGINCNDLKLIMLAIPSVQEMKNILYQLKKSDFRGKIATIAHYDDEREKLVELGADIAFNFYSEVGAGFAEEAAHLIEGSSKETRATPN